MLGTRNDRTKRSFVEELERYLGETLHGRFHLRELKDLGKFPAFLTHTYTFYYATIAGRRCVFLAAGREVASPSDIAKHVNLVRSADEGIVVFAAPSLGAHNRSRLIKHRVPFVVPGNQLYIPDLALDLREYFRAYNAYHPDGLTPAAQAVLFYYLLGLGTPEPNPSLIATQLHLTAMSIGRAFDDLVAHGLADSQKQGRARNLHFKDRGRSLLESAQPYLRSPVRSIKYLKGRLLAPHLKRAGESALADLTNLSEPHTRTYAIAARDWRTFASRHHVTETDALDADFIIETWAYEPAALSNKPTVDPLSLYVQFRDHADERVAGAARELLEHMSW